MRVQPSCVRSPWGHGEGHRNAKLNIQKVLEIRKLYSQGERIQDIADRYGVRYNAILRVVNRKTWSTVG